MLAAGLQPDLPAVRQVVRARDPLEQAVEAAHRRERSLENRQLPSGGKMVEARVAASSQRCFGDRGLVAVQDRALPARAVRVVLAIGGEGVRADRDDVTGDHAAPADPAADRVPGLRDPAARA
jgi:hypothetical protein